MSKVRQTAATLAAIAITVWVTLNIHTSPVNAQDQTNDKPPIVRIMAPTSNSTYKWNTLVDYSVVVSDQGKSTKYQEIPSSQVLLKTTYVPDLSEKNVNSVQMSQSSPDGLVDIISSNCLGCHQFKSKAMGPSFSAIGKRYPDGESSIDTLSQHIREGSVGVWGQARMPSHPEFTEKELHAISSWIMKDSTDPNVNYYVGTEGTFQMGSPAKPGPNAGVILVASYASHGSKADTQQTLRGQDTIIVHGQ